MTIRNETLWRVYCGVSGAGEAVRAGAAVCQYDDDEPISCAGFRGFSGVFCADADGPYELVCFPEIDDAGEYPDYPAASADSGTESSETYLGLYSGNHFVNRVFPSLDAVEDGLC